MNRRGLMEILVFITLFIPLLITAACTTQEDTSIAFLPGNILDEGTIFTTSENGDVRTLVHIEGLEISNIVWASDGSKLASGFVADPAAFVMSDINQCWGILIVDRNGSNQKLVWLSEKY